MLSQSGNPRSADVGEACPARLPQPNGMWEPTEIKQPVMRRACNCPAPRRHRTIKAVTEDDFGWLSALFRVELLVH
jgi:hypothetical protein